MNTETFGYPTGYAPHIRAHRDTSTLGMLYSLSMMPLWIASTYRHGLIGFLLPTLAVLIFAGVEMLFSFFLFGKDKKFDYFSVATGLGVATVLPVTLPLPIFFFVVIVSALLGRQLLHRKFLWILPIPMIARMVIAYLYPSLFAFPAGDSILGSMTAQGFSTMGGDCIASIALSYIFLVSVRWERLRTAILFFLFSLGSSIILTLLPLPVSLFGDFSRTEYFLQSGVVFYGFILLTDMRNLPVSILGQWIYSMIAAGSAILLWVLGWGQLSVPMAALGLSCLYTLIQLPFIRIRIKSRTYRRKT